MLGHLKPSTCSISSAAEQSYQQFYCGICTSLRKEKGLFASLLINHELSLNLLALAPYMEQTAIVETPCPSSLFTKNKNAFSNLIVDKASQLSILLGWIKSTDWAFDSGNSIASIIQQKLNSWNKNVNVTLSESLQQVITQYIEIIKTEQPLDQDVEKTSGQLAKEIWFELSAESIIPTHLKGTYSHLFEQIGELIYLADAIEDYFQDKKKSLFNPIITLEEKESSENALIQFYDRYRFKVICIQNTIRYITHRFSPNSEFIQVLNSSINRLDESVLEHKQNIVEGTEPTLISNIMETFQQFDFTTGQCCCHNCCNNCQCPCTNCNCNCPTCNGCDCGCTDCNCPSCNCCEGTNCCNSSSNSGYESNDALRQSIIESIENSDMSDSAKQEAL